MWLSSLIIFMVWITQLMMLCSVRVNSRSCPKWKKNGLGMEVVDNEVCKAVFYMAPPKAPGVDGFYAKLFQSQWDTIGASVCLMVRNVMGGCPLDRRINRTLLSLIPKVQHPGRVTQLKPICLCTVVYKIITKSIVNKLRALMGNW